MISQPSSHWARPELERRADTDEQPQSKGIQPLVGVRCCSLEQGALETEDLSVSKGSVFNSSSSNLRVHTQARARCVERKQEAIAHNRVALLYARLEQSAHGLTASAPMSKGTCHTRLMLDDMQTLWQRTTPNAQALVGALASGAPCDAVLGLSSTHPLLR